MFKNLGSYYLAVFKKYGVIIPAVLVVIAYAILISIEATDAITALIHNGIGGFIAIAAVAVVALAGGIVYTVLKLNSKEVGIMDLGVTVLSAIALLTIVMFCFAPGVGWFAGLKWGVSAALLITCVAFAVVRSNKIA